MNQISTFLLKTHVVLSTLWALLDSLSNSIIVEAKHITEPKKILSAASAPHVRHKRNILQFGNMVTCVTEKNSLDYSDYGCYCGMGGMGQPVDELDWCCFDHDECWSKVVEDPECSGLSSPYVVTYDWGCSANTNSVHCYNDYEDNSCARRTCECDRIASECFARNEFHWEFYDLDPYFEHCNTTVDLSVRNPTTEAPNAKESSSAPSQHIVTSQWTMVAVAMAIMRLVTTSFTAETHWQSGV